MTLSYSNKTIEEVLNKFRPMIGMDYDKYRNHVYRVFLNCLLLDTDEGNDEKYAIAAAFHDIGIWTNRTIDYLAPSITQAKIYLSATHRQHWAEEITMMIHWHHKWTSYKGAKKSIVENFRKADWIDVSLGWIRFGVDNERLANHRRVLPNLGFHFFLIKKLAKNFIRRPLNPLPMFTR